MLTPVITSDQCLGILHRHLVDDGCVTDLVMSNAAHRFTPVPAYLEQQIRTYLAELSQARAELSQAQAELSQAQAELSQARAELVQVRAELVQVQTERDAILRSSSWRLAAPFRWIKQRGTAMR